MAHVGPHFDGLGVSLLDRFPQEAAGDILPLQLIDR